MGLSSPRLPKPNQQGDPHRQGVATVRYRHPAATHYAHAADQTESWSAALEAVCKGLRSQLRGKEPIKWLGEGFGKEGRQVIQ